MSLFLTIPCVDRKNKLQISIPLQLSFLHYPFVFRFVGFIGHFETIKYFVEKEIYNLCTCFWYIAKSQNNLPMHEVAKFVILTLDSKYLNLLVNV